ncbi:NAD dependent epimerase/dehydratase [Colletotrichum scovillei]|uniref:NAD dependent epimerase/dehydratase n=1 Tax=Colletotrichum scovillei TaxID=1209932 RepID=A0A9P7R4X4_9PEZI|nr:NAD dependent epimerase/dehydratase [Colletotrichum scovillei]KAG7060075.1 NAD dependent epimerase/dehydratase [Colletotrichum scovillei]KAG7067500.1 NAD dependent epimerase/dehydratase [Colletotrichum scovillei]
MSGSNLPPKILLSGATGYVGGSVLHHLLKHPSLTSIITSSSPITLLVRGGLDRAAKLTDSYGSLVKPVSIVSYDDTLALTALASEHDIVINAGSGFHPPSAEAFVHGLAKRKDRNGGQPVWIIHTSGASNIADKPLTGVNRPDAEYEDAVAEKKLAVLRVGEEIGVNAVSIQSPCIFGPGSGLFNKAGLMIPIMTGYVLENGCGLTLGDKTGCIDYVHVSDLADLYVLCVLDIIERGGANVPKGKKGIMFPTVGRTLTIDIPRKCLDIAFATGNLPKKGGPQEKIVRNVSLAEAAETCAGNMDVAETGYAGHRKTKGTVAREKLGWKPVYGEEAWCKDFETELRAALNGQRPHTMGNCIAGTK